MTGDRFALARVGNGAVLLDTVSGAILELNESAAFAWERKLNGEPAEAIVQAFVSRYSLPLGAATQDVDRVLDPHLESVPPEVGDFRYAQTPDGYTFTFREQVVFVLDPAGQRVKLLNDVGEMLTSLLRALAPKLLALQGEVVLHASAVELNGTVVAFTGASGAGKTTTARALAEAGGQIVCEDQLWVALRNTRAMVSEGGERAILAWVAEAVRELRLWGEVGCGGFSTIGRQGKFLPLAEIGFIDARRRIGNRYLSKELRPWQTAGLVFRNSFHGSAERPTWIRQLECAAQIGSGTTGLELALPEGLDGLAAAMRRIAAAASLRS
jgi:hypothetical protein